MVNIGAGGAFSGLTYTDEEGTLCTAADYILNRLPLAQARQYVQTFYAIYHIQCVKPGTSERKDIV